MTKKVYKGSAKVSKEGQTKNRNSRLDWKTKKVRQNERLTTMFIRKDEEKTVDGEVEKIPAAINENALNSREKRANNIHYGRTVPQGVCTAKNRKDKYQFDNVQRGEKTRRKHSHCTSHTHARARKLGSGTRRMEKPREMRMAGELVEKTRVPYLPAAPLPLRALFQRGRRWKRLITRRLAVYVCF